MPTRWQRWNSYRRPETRARQPEACVLSMAECEDEATTFVNDGSELIPCCDSCKTAWDWRRQRKAEADSARGAYSEVIDNMVDKLEGK